MLFLTIGLDAYYPGYQRFERGWGEREREGRTSGHTSSESHFHEYRNLNSESYWLERLRGMKQHCDWLLKITAIKTGL